MPISKDPEKRKRQLANLENGKKTQFYGERAVKAQKKSTEVQIAKRTQREYYEMLDARVATDGNGKPVKDKDGNVVTGAYQRSAKVYKMAKEGNLEAAKYIDKMLGQAPNEQVDVNLGGSVNVEQRYVFHDIEEEDL